MPNLFKNKEDQEVKIGKPEWLKTKISSGKEYRETKKAVKEHQLHTICESGKCPNQAECWGAGTATFMILGDTCTRSCQFCNVNTGMPEDVDPFEALRVAKSIKLMGLKHAVITSVDRDDLPDGGADAWRRTVELIRKHNPGITMETLIPDFKGEWENLKPILEVAPEVVSHNMETVRRITRKVRVQAKYDRSLEVLKRLKDGGISRTKSGIMLGLGEQDEEVIETMDDLRAVGVNIMTMGQYMQPSKKHLPVVEFVHPDKFAYFKEEGLKRGFTHVESGPLVRSSYHAEKHL
ncbi:MAG: lipoyl synthase [Vicingaceae bacterium]